MDQQHQQWQGEERRSLGHIEKKLDEITTCIASLKQAFPDGDLSGHRKFHEAAIKASEAQERFWNDLKLDVAKKGVWGLLVIIIGLVLVGVTTKMGAVLK